MPNDAEIDGSSGSTNQGPVGQGNYEVQPGDCMASIAHAHGFLWQTLWNLPENAELKRNRQPNVLFPGDCVTIPPVRIRQESSPTDQLAKFQLAGAPCRLKLRFLDDKQEPRSGLAYQLTIDGQTTSGTLDGGGGLDVPISPDASQGSILLNVEPDPETYPLNFGHLDPDSSATGIRGRLNNLGFACASDGDWDADLQSAIKRFQLANDIQPTGQLDDQTRQALIEGHQS